MNDRLYRSRDDRMLAGVAGGLADLWDADPSLVRIIWALLVVFTGGLALVVYIVMAIVVPDGDPYMTPMPGAMPSADPSDPASTPTAGTPTAAASGWTAPSATDPGRSARRAAARAQRRSGRGSRDGAPGALIVGTLLVLLGIFFLAREFLPEIDFDWFWPLVLVGVGVVVVVSALGHGPGDDTSGGAKPGDGTRT